MQIRRMYFCRSAMLPLLSLVVLSCGRPDSDCSDVWRAINTSDPIRLSSLKRVPYPRVETHLIAEVDRCYRSDRPGAALLFADEWRDRQGRRYLAFTIIGTADVAFVAVVDESGSIVRTGEASTNW